MEENKSNEDPIDFKGLWEFFQNILDWWAKLLLDLVNVLIRNWKLMLLMGTLSLVAGYVAFVLSPKVYQMSMTLKPNQLSNPNTIELARPLEQLASLGSSQQLASLLNIQEQDAEAIISIKHEVIFPEYVSPNPYQEFLPFRIKVELSDHKIGRDLEQAVIRYFDESPYVVKHQKIRMESLTNRLAKIEQEMEHIEQLKKAYLDNMKMPSEKAEIQIGSDVDPINFNDKALELFQQKQDIINSLKENENVSLISPLAVSDVPSSPKLFSYLSLSLLVGLGLSYFFLLLRMRLGQ